MESTTTPRAVSQSPIRGSLKLSINPSSPQVAAGSDFSIFIVILNPFEIPIAVYQVQTHIPVELIDVNGRRLRLAASVRDRESSNSKMRRIVDWLGRRVQLDQDHTGIAIAVGTDFDPKVEKDFISSNILVHRAGPGVTVAGVQFVFPQNPSAEELDRIFRRLDDYKKGLIPVTLQPGDSVVRQFVLRTFCNCTALARQLCEAVAIQPAPSRRL